MNVRRQTKHVCKTINAKQATVAYMDVYCISDSWCLLSITLLFVVVKEVGKTEPL